MAATYPTTVSQTTPPGGGLPTDDVYVLPASVAQQRFWLLDQLEPGNTSLNMPLALRLEGELDVDALQRTLNEVVARHEVLRTNFVLQNGKPVQVVATAAWLNLEIVDVSDLCEAEREVRLKDLMRAEAHITFDLARGPLFKTKLLRLGSREHVLLLTLHHIICDGWSNGVLVREIGEIYRALSQGEASSLPELPIQYADFALWQQQWLESEAFDEQLAYWKSQLGSELTALEIPTDFPRNKNRASYGAIESLLLPRPLTRALKALSQREDVTPFMIYLAAFKILLHRYSGQESIMVGSPTANRIQSQTEELIGPFANTLMLQTDLSGAPSFSDALRRVKEVSLGAFGNQTLPFEKLVEAIKPAKGRNSNQLFQVLFVFQTAFMQPVALSDLAITPMRSVSPGSLFELSLGVVERAEGTRLQLEYNTDLYTPETIKRMLENLRNILHAAVIDIRQTIADIELIAESQPATVEPQVRDANLHPSSLASSRVEHAARTLAAKRNGSSSDDIELTLKEIWQDVLHVATVEVKDDFFEMGGHSLLAASLFDEITKKLGVNLPLATLFKATTIEQLAELIREEKTDDKWTSLVPINPNGSKVPLFLVHAAGGNIFFYKDLIERLGPDQPCYGLQARGLDGKQTAYDCIEDMAAHYIKEIVMVHPNGPYRVGGSSFGGLVAYEIARQLCQMDKQVDLVALFDTYAPGYPKLLPGRSKLRIKFLKFLDRIEHHVDTLRVLEPGTRWPYFVAKKTKARNLFRRAIRNGRKSLARGALRSLGRPLPEAMLKTQNAIVEASRAYRPQPYPGVITLFRATKQQRGTCDERTLGWQELAAGGLEIHEVRGTHGSIVVEPRVRLVVDTLQSYLTDPDSRPAALVAS